MQKPKLHPVNTIFFTGTALVAALGAALYFYYRGLTWQAVTLVVFMFSLTLMAISGGYHRLYAHRTHEAAPWLKLFYMFFGAAAFQQSCIKWATEHRDHHRFVDTDKDPYNIKAGAFWAHIGWILYEDRIAIDVPKDLKSDPILAWQEKYWLPLAIFFCFGFPTIVGWALGDAWAGFIFGGFVRLVLAHHCTFFINSLAHMVGSQPYTDSNTARDSWITAVFTFGEGYHNFHHWSPGDYRNGVRLFHWDPPKWFICALSWVGQTWDIHRNSEENIAKAKAQMALKSAAVSHGPFREKMEERYQAFLNSIEELSTRRKELMTAASHEAEVLRAKFEDSRAQFLTAKRNWKEFLRQVKRGALVNA